MKMKVVLIVVLMVLASYMTAEDPDTPKPLLKKGDVVHFIKTFPLLKKDFEKFGVKYEAKEGTVTWPDAVKTSTDFMAILKKHGWDEHYFEKVMAITLGYATVAYKKGFAESDPQLQKAINDIKSNTALSDEMKKQLIQNLMATRGVMKEQAKQFNKRVHKDDMALIQSHVDELKEVYEKN